jgi:hypothetical protein
VVPTLHLRGTGDKSVTELERAAGVYASGRDGRPTLVHEYLSENYDLADITELLQIGTLMPASGDVPARLVIDRKGLTELRNLINAFSFDYDQGFVEMCLDMARFADEQPGEALTFVSSD